jgi:predicted metal-dependent peptidase
VAGSHELWDQLDDDPIMKEYIKDIIRKSKDLCNRDYGNIPGEVIDAVDQMLKTSKPIIPWNKVLRMFCASATESMLDYTMKKISKRYGTRPGTRKEDVLNLAVAVDTSGSISQEQLMIFFNEIAWIWKNGANVMIYEADCDICDVYKFKGKWKGDVKGRGGTDLEPVLVECEKRYDALIYFTDFYAPKIEKKYNIPILWVLTSELEREHFPYEWGKHVKIDGGIAQAV